MTEAAALRSAAASVSLCLAPAWEPQRGHPRNKRISLYETSDTSTD